MLEAMQYWMPCPESHSWWIVKRPLGLCFLSPVHNSLSWFYRSSFLSQSFFSPLWVFTESMHYDILRMKGFLVGKTAEQTDSLPASHFFPVFPYQRSRGRVSPWSPYFRIPFYNIWMGDSEEIHILSLSIWPNMKYVPKCLSNSCPFCSSHQIFSSFSHHNLSLLFSNILVTCLAPSAWSLSYSLHCT